MASFEQRLSDRSVARNSHLCVGLDPDPAKLPPELLLRYSLSDAVREFSLDIIRATSPFAVSFKFNIAFFEALGEEGPRILRAVLSAVPPDVLSIADAKRGDIGNSARFYATAFLGELDFDAITLSPYMGRDSVLPFLEYEEKAVFILVRTSNPGGDDFQLLDVNGSHLYEVVARHAVDWGSEQPGSIGFVAGATDVAALSGLRRMHPTVPFLIPGVGAQGGDAEAVMASAGTGPVLINSSRQILYASSGTDYAAEAAVAAEQLRDELNQAIAASHHTQP